MMLSSPVLRVILFLAPLCPICQNMSYDLRQLEAEFAEAPVEFLGVFPNASTRQDPRKKNCRSPFGDPDPKRIWLMALIDAGSDH